MPSSGHCVLRSVAMAAALVLTIGAAAAPLAGSVAGPLVVVGGGRMPGNIVRRTLELAGGGQPIVAVLPQASPLADAGESSVEMWLAAGAAEARIVRFADRAAARTAIERATVIWLPGGDQNSFMSAIAGTGLDDVIRARHAAGVVVGGTSAGAEVLGKVMLTGRADLQSLTTRSTETAAGLGLWPDVLVDSHFLRRQRGNRLLSAILDHPALVGVGIDEGTAVVVQGSVIEVLGDSAVVVIDARKAAAAPRADGLTVAGTGLAVHVLRAGMSIDLK